MGRNGIYAFEMKYFQEIYIPFTKIYQGSLVKNTYLIFPYT